MLVCIGVVVGHCGFPSIGAISDLKSRRSPNLRRVFSPCRARAQLVFETFLGKVEQRSVVHFGAAFAKPRRRDDQLVRQALREAERPTFGMGAATAEARRQDKIFANGGSQLSMLRPHDHQLQADFLSTDKREYA
jgi:hypothetical protein